MGNELCEKSGKNYLDLTERKLTHLYRSVNQLQLSPGREKPAEVVEAYILIFQEKPDVSSIYVGVFFTESLERILYRMNSFASNVVNERLEKAENFAEKMGFDMDPVKIEMDEAGRPIGLNLPFFHQDVEAFKQAAQDSKNQEKIAHVEDSSGIGSDSDFQGVFLKQYITILSML